MTNDDKVAYILNNMSINFNEFLKQAKYKLFKQYTIVNSDSYKELVSDILYSIISKLNTNDNINRFYNMAIKNTLKLFIFKAIDSNSRFFTAPFLRNKIKEYNRITYTDKYHDIIDNVNDNNEEDEIKTDLVLNMLEPINAKRIFGEQWEYYTIIFKEYIFEKTSYKKLSIKYNIPISNLYFHIRWIKEKIREELPENYKVNKSNK
jgi:hypothetical protein